MPKHEMCFSCRHVQLMSETVLLSVLWRCKYLYLLFDDSFLADRNYVFTTEGHPLPVISAWHDRLPENYIATNWTSIKVSSLFRVRKIPCLNTLLPNSKFQFNLFKHFFTASLIFPQIICFHLKYKLITSFLVLKVWFTCHKKHKKTEDSYLCRAKSKQQEERAQCLCKCVLQQPWAMDKVINRLRAPAMSLTPKATTGAWLKMNAGLMQPLVDADHAAWLATVVCGCSYDPTVMATLFSATNK